MKKELGAWNDGAGIDFDAWISCSGNFGLAVGYSSIFCPQFVEFEHYIFSCSEVTQQAIKNIRDFETREQSTPKTIESLFNHLHISDLHAKDDLSVDKIIIIGQALKDIYQARLHFLFPNKPCRVEFYIPNDPELYDEYQLTFWQAKHQ